MPLGKKKSRDLISLILMAAIYKNKLIRIKKISTMQLSPWGTRQSSCRVWNPGFSPKHTESNGTSPLLSDKIRRQEEKNKKFISSCLFLRTYLTALFYSCNITASFRYTFYCNAPDAFTRTLVAFPGKYANGTSSISTITRLSLSAPALTASAFASSFACSNAFSRPTSSSK